MVSSLPDPSLILIAERDKKVRELQRFFLERANFQVAFVDSEQSAMEHIHTAQPVALVTEILIGGMDGLTLCRRVSEDPLTSRIPVVVFSILAAEVRARDAGASAFLRKPLVESTFIATIQRVIATPPSTRSEPQ